VYKLILLNSSSNIVVFSHSTREYLFCAVAEANEKDPLAYDDASLLDKLPLEATALLPLTMRPEELPFGMAKAMESVLKKWSEQGIGPGAVLYAGVLLSEGKVYGCTAGDCRIHLAKGGQVVAVTRDHNLIDDPTEDAELIEDPIFHQVYLSTSTRTIGVVTGGREPECVEWDASSSFSIFICTSKFHRYRRPSEYIDSLLDWDWLNPGSNDQKASGIFIRIDGDS
jgi:hypothetical protein